ncbi:hypothetical protein [Nocardia brasiliensis]|uniref:hypothetical protein n=1 Tax=Nocardia brasiliensis TaxID=37326 RepID=UPI0024570ADD|nr:hypothetical protein [Nocardia brasiliensis]
MSRRERQHVSQYESARPVTDWDVEMFAKAFGFDSSRHFDDALAGRSPSALRDGRLNDRSAAKWRSQKAGA